jgi:SAM-dependent methyltransferase
LTEPTDGLAPPTVEAGAARYDTIGVNYSSNRREEPGWRDAIARALSTAKSVLNVGAGSGNYEPTGPGVVAVEPSETMLAQRRDGAAPAVQGLAESLPFGERSFDAALAVLTVHHWRDPVAGLGELARVARRQVVVTWDPTASGAFWLHRDYLPELRQHEARLSSLADVLAVLNVLDVTALDVPRGCADGFLGAHWEEPTWYLDEDVRAAMSGLALLDQSVVERALAQLRADLDDGTWARRNAGLAKLESLDAGFRLVTAGA